SDSAEESPQSADTNPGQRHRCERPISRKRTPTYQSRSGSLPEARLCESAHIAAHHRWLSLLVSTLASSSRRLAVFDTLPPSLDSFRQSNCFIAGKAAYYDFHR